MGEIKWIKLTTNIFDDEKIKLIDSLPERDAILVIWFKLLTLAGKTNDNGLVYVSKKMPITDEMLSTIFARPLNIVRLALSTFDSFEMIEIEDHINISNWNKHQNIEGMEKIREQNKLRKQKQRGKEKTLLVEETRSSHVMSRDSHATEIDKEKEKEIDIEIDDKDKDKDLELKKIEKNHHHHPNKKSEIFIEKWNSLGITYLTIDCLDTKTIKYLNEIDEIIFSKAISKVKESNYLKQAKFLWFIKSENLKSIVEGKYDSFKPAAPKKEISYIDPIEEKLAQRYQDRKNKENQERLKKLINGQGD